MWVPLMLYTLWSTLQGSLSLRLSSEITDGHRVVRDTGHQGHAAQSRLADAHTTAAGASGSYIGRKPDATTSFRCAGQQYPGIYADPETGCQVFHFCESSGRNASFYCPEHTLFNQQFFVCDWSYNVDCSASVQFYAYNKDIYITPEKIYAPVYSASATHQPTAQPAIPQHPQPTHYHKGSSLEVSQALASHASQLASSSSSLPEDKTLGNARSLGYRQGSHNSPSIILSTGQVPEGESGLPSTNFAQASSASYSSLPSSPSSSPTTTPAYSSPATTTQPPLVSVTTLSTLSYPSATVSYSPAASYDDVADPEPSAAAYNSIDPNSDAADPEPYGYSSLQSVGDQQSSASSSSQINANPAISYDPYDPYGSADPEPAAYYDSADPEPASYYTDTVDLSGSYKQLVGQTGQVQVYSSSSNSGDDAADPEPSQYFTPSIDLTGGGGGSSAANNPAASKIDNSLSSYNLYSSQNTFTDFYNGSPSNGLVDSSDPEPDPEFIPYN